MENNKQKIFHSLTKNKNVFRSSNSSKKIILKHYNPVTKKLLFPKKIGITKFLYNNNKITIQNKNTKSYSSGKKRYRNKNICYNLTDYMKYSNKKNASLNNTYTSKLKKKLFFNIYNKNSNLKKALKNKKINYSFINYNINKNKLYKKIIGDNSVDKNSFFHNFNYNNFINNTNYVDLNKNYNNKITLNNVMPESYSFIYKRNKSLFKSNTYSNLEIICEGINNNINNINNHINNINIHCTHSKHSKLKKSEMSPKIKNNYTKMFENKKIKKNKTNSFLLLTSINNNNYTNILNYNFSRKKHSNKKKLKIKLNKSHNKTLNENRNKYKLNEFKTKMEKLFDDNIKNSKRKKYNLIKDKFDETINIMGLNNDEKKILKLIMNNYNDVIESYSKENNDLKKTNEELENKYNQNMLLLKEFQKNNNKISNDNNNNSIQK